MGDGDVAANKALLAQAAEKANHVAGCDSAARIAAVNGVPLEPIGVNDG
jgi:hypothetical protein